MIFTFSFSVCLLSARLRRRRRGRCRHRCRRSLDSVNCFHVFMVTEEFGNLIGRHSLNVCAAVFRQHDESRRRTNMLPSPLLSSVFLFFFLHSLETAMVAMSVVLSLPVILSLEMSFTWKAINELESDAKLPVAHTPLRMENVPRR